MHNLNPGRFGDLCSACGIQLPLPFAATAEDILQTESRSRCRRIKPFLPFGKAHSLHVKRGQTPGESVDAIDAEARLTFAAGIAQAIPVHAGTDP